MKILDIKSNQSKVKKLPHPTDNSKSKDKYIIPSNSEWTDSSYFFNNSLSKSLPLVDKLVLKYIKMYFNMYNESDKLVKFYSPLKSKRLLLSRKVWVSKVQLKHTTNKVIINTYIYDRSNNIISKKLNLFAEKNYKNAFEYLTNNNISNAINVFSNIKYKILSSPVLNNSINTITNLNIKLKSLIELLNKKNNESVNDNNLLSHVNTIEIFNNKLNKYSALFFKSFILKKKLFLTEKFWEHTKITLYYYRFILLNTLKYKSLFITNFLKILSKLYGNKKIVLNIVLLKNYQYNSNIFSQILAHKIQDRNNNTQRMFKSALAKIKIPTFRKSIISRILKEKNKQYISIKYNIDYKNNNNTDNLIRSNYKEKFINVEHLTLNKLNNKSIIGVRLEGAGRLTKRISANRSVKKSKYIGTLKNIDSSFKGLSSQMVRNKINSNTQYSNVNSKNRIGSFGIKGWINTI